MTLPISIYAGSQWHHVISYDDKYSLFIVKPILDFYAEPYFIQETQVTKRKYL